MSVAPALSEVFERAVEEGERRLNQSLLELVSSGFIAGSTIVFGILAQVMVHGELRGEFGSLAAIAGELAFGIGVVFLVVGRSELFSENFFDPVATAVDRSGSWLVGPILRLWSVPFLLNLVGGVVFLAVLSVEGALPPETGVILREEAHAVVKRDTAVVLSDAFTGGALVTLLSYLLNAVETVGERITLSYVVGFLLALGPFDHVIVTALHVIFGIFVGAEVGLGRLAWLVVLVTAGNLVGGLGLVTLSHVAQAKGAGESEG